MKNPGFSIVIPNANGKQLLERFLPAVMQAAAVTSVASEVIVVDDASSDGSVDFLLKNYPLIKLVRLISNGGFGAAVNAGVRAATYPIVVLLNNDVKPQPDFLTPLMEHFNDPDLFAVRIKSIIMEDSIKDQVESWVGAEFKYGFIHGLNEKECLRPDRLSFTAGGGAMAIDKEKFWELGGFDCLFYPFYWEDMDLCYRAWKRGWKVAYEPQSILYHYHRSTILRLFSSSYVAFVGERNRYLVIWKNITDPLFLLKHLCWVPARLLVQLFRGKLMLVRSFFAALKKLPQVLERRKQEKKYILRKDQEIFSLFKNQNQGTVLLLSVLYIEERGKIHGGGQIYLLNLMANLNKNKFLPVFICPNDDEMAEAARKFGAKVYFIDMPRLSNPLNVSLWIRTILQLSKVIKQEKIKLVHSNAALRGSVFGVIAAKINRIPFIWHIHVFYSARFSDIILSFLCDKIIVVARICKKRFFWLGDSRKLIVNHNGVDLHKFEQAKNDGSLRTEFSISRDTSVVGSIGLLHPIKGQDIFLNAAKQVLSLFPETKFLIVGDDDTPRKEYRIKLEDLSKELGITDKVIFCGWRKNIPEVLAAMDIFILPSRIDHFPLVVLEAMAAAKPVIATRVGGVPELIENGVNGILVDVNDPGKLSAAISEFLQDKAKARKLADSGHKRVEDYFTVKANTSRVEEVYAELLEKPGHER